MTDSMKIIIILTGILFALLFIGIIIFNISTSLATLASIADSLSVELSQ